MDLMLLVDGEVVDTHGGDFTYRSIHYAVGPGGYEFYESFSGARADSWGGEPHRLTDPKEIDYYASMIPAKGDKA